VVGADAHEPGRVGESFDAALRLLADCGYREVSYFRQRTRHDVPITTAQASLLAARAA
jgi:histidinol-phosphatase (PHP family)